MSDQIDDTEIAGKVLVAIGIWRQETGLLDAYTAGIPTVFLDGRVERGPGMQASVIRLAFDRLERFRRGLLDEIPVKPTEMVMLGRDASDLFRRSPRTLGVAEIVAQWVADHAPLSDGLDESWEPTVQDELFPATETGR